MTDSDVAWLPARPAISAALAARLRTDYEAFADAPPTAPLDRFVAERYGLELAADYAGFPLRNPWGKASGQLSMTAHQVQEDADAGLGFVVLKTVIACDATGAQSMEAWAIREAKMVAERIVGRSGEAGWTITWKGRGWWQSFDDYLQLVRDAVRIAGADGPLIVPSCKYHLPSIEGEAWRTGEYDHTTARLLEAWRTGPQATSPSGAPRPMPLEKDFSPTLAGSDLARERVRILDWLRTVPRLVRDAARTAMRTSPTDSPPVRLGLKLFNAVFDDEFQLDMLEAVHRAAAPERPDFYVYGNRLFDPDREFDGKRGIAFGGPDLSDRNLRMTSRFRDRCRATSPPIGFDPLPWSATGNVVTGRTALEYALRGASSFQLHTFFQLPADQYRRPTGSKVEKALHELYLHPETGFVAWLHHLAEALDLPREPIRFRDVVGQGDRLRERLG